MDFEHSNLISIHNRVRYLSITALKIQVDTRFESSSSPSLVVFVTIDSNYVNSQPVDGRVNAEGKQPGFVAQFSGGLCPLDSYRLN